jgi:hypothetical protein
MRSFDLEAYVERAERLAIRVAAMISLLILIIKTLVHELR